MIRLSIAAALAALACAAHPAAAQGVAWLTTSNGSEFYPQSWPAGQTSVNQLGTGQYQATFYGLGSGYNSDVQVTAINAISGPHYCTSAGWYSANGTDVTANVDCFDPNGNPSNSDFTVFYQTRTGAPATGTVAFVWGNQPTTTDYTPDQFYSFNSTGGTNTIHRENTGLYFVYMPGIVTNGGNAQVTAYGGAATHCQVVDWYHNISGTNVVVYCFDGNGNPADEYFDMAFTVNATEAVGTSTATGGYAWANQPTATGTYVPSRRYDWNNATTKPMTVQNAGTGVSFLNLRLPANSLGFSSTLGMVTAYGSAGEFCDAPELGYFGSAKKQTLTLFVNCFDAHGNPVAADYSGQIMTGN